MSNAKTENLRIANANLRARLARLSPESNASLPGPADFSDLLEDLLQAGGYLRGIPAGSHPDMPLAQAISEYRNTVEQLARLLPGIHGRLLNEKARMEVARAHLSAAAAWAQASPSTL